MGRFFIIKLMVIVQVTILYNINIYSYRTHLREPHERVVPIGIVVVHNRIEITVMVMVKDKAVISSVAPDAES